MEVSALAPPLLLLQSPHKAGLPADFLTQLDGAEARSRMQLPMKLVRVYLVSFAVLLSAFQAFLSNMTVMIFSGHESTRMWASIYAPAFLFVTALFCYKFPRSGVLAFATVFAISLLFCVDPWREGQILWAACVGSLRFGLYGGVFLLVSVALDLPRIRHA